MTNFQPTHRHKVTGKEYQLECDYADGAVAVWNELGFRYIAKLDMLEPLTPNEGLKRGMRLAIQEGIGGSR